MAESSGFFPSVSNDREYTSSWLAQYIAAIIGNGVYNGNQAVTADGSGMSITVPAGQAWINGYYYRNDGDMAFAIANADGVLNRKDTVVLRWDINERSITVQVLQGTPASTATAPAIVRTAEQYDLKLAEISISAGTTAITQSLITDTRLNDTVCGIVTGVVDQVDTTTFYNQIQNDLAQFKSGNEADFTTWSDTQKQSFQTWFDGIKNILGEDEAASLLNLINAHKADASVHITQLTCTTTSAVHALTGLSATSGLVSCVFKADADYAEGDTFTVDETAYAVVTSSGETLRAGAFLSGGIVPIELDVDSKVLHIRQDAAAKALTVTQGYGGTTGSYDGSAAVSVSVPHVTFHTADPTTTLADGELWVVY